MPRLKVGQRVKYRLLRGTVLSAYLPIIRNCYQVRFDNGILAIGSTHQLKPVRRVTR